MVFFILSYALHVNAQTEMKIVTARYYQSDNNQTRLNYTEFGEPSPAFSLGTLWNGPANKNFKTMILRWRIADQLGQFGNVPAYSKLEYEYRWGIEGARSNTHGSAGVVRALFESETDSLRPAFMWILIIPAVTTYIIEMSLQIGAMCSPVQEAVLLTTRQAVR